MKNYEAQKGNLKKALKLGLIAETKGRPKTLKW